MKGFIRRQKLVNWIKNHKTQLIAVGTSAMGLTIGLLVGTKMPSNTKKTLPFIDTGELVNYISQKLNLDSLKVEAVLDAEAIYQANKGIIFDPDGSFVNCMEEEIERLLGKTVGGNET